MRPIGWIHRISAACSPASGHEGCISASQRSAGPSGRTARRLVRLLTQKGNLRFCRLPFCAVILTRFGRPPLRSGLPRTGKCPSNAAAVSGFAAGTAPSARGLAVPCLRFFSAAAVRFLVPIHLPVRVIQHILQSVCIIEVFLWQRITKPF